MYRDDYVRLLEEFAEQRLPKHILHSGTPSGGTICTTIQCWYEWDEDDCEQEWSNHLDSINVYEDFTIEDLLEHL